jgi:DNA-binding MarR family transcriptional regulator
LTAISHNYIVFNVSSTTTSSSAEREEQLDYLAEHLPSRAVMLVRLLVKQVRASEASRTELEVLSILAEGPRRITELAELEGTAQPTMTLLVKRLQEKGWAEREGLQRDGRVVMVSITEAGRAAQQRCRARFLAAMRADLQELSDEELRALSAATETISAFVDDLQQRAGRSIREPDGRERRALEGELVSRAGAAG